MRTTAAAALYDVSCIYFGLRAVMDRRGRRGAARRTLGTVVIMGMGFDTLFASFLIPVSFYAIERISRWRGPEHDAAPQPFRHL